MRNAKFLSESRQLSSFSGRRRSARGGESDNNIAFITLPNRLIRYVCSKRETPSKNFSGDSFVDLEKPSERIRPEERSRSRISKIDWGSAAERPLTESLRQRPFPSGRPDKVLDAVAVSALSERRKRTLEICAGSVD